MPSYDVVTSTRRGTSRVHRYATDDGLRPGDVLRLTGRWWLVVEVTEDGASPRALTLPARYRMRLEHPDGRQELGAFRRFRTGAPRLGHAFTTTENGQPLSWQVVDERLMRDEQDEGYLELLARRDYSEAEGALPDHELEHVLARLDEQLPAEAYAALLEATEDGLSFELAALEPGEEPDWDEARRFIDALVIDEVEDDLLELCGVNPEADPQETWLEKVKARLRADLERFRADVEGNHVEIEEWDYLDGRVFASVGRWEDEGDPDSGHGWMCRLLDSGALGAAGFSRVRRTEL